MHLFGNDAETVWLENIRKYVSSSCPRQASVMYVLCVALLVADSALLSNEWFKYVHCVALLAADSALLSIEWFKYVLCVALLWPLSHNFSLLNGSNMLSM